MGHTRTQSHVLVRLTRLRLRQDRKGLLETKMNRTRPF